MDNFQDLVLQSPEDFEKRIAHLKDIVLFFVLNLLMLRTWLHISSSHISTGSLIFPENGNFRGISGDSEAEIGICAFQLRPIIFRKAEISGKFTLTLTRSQRHSTNMKQPNHLSDGS